MATNIATLLGKSDSELSALMGHDKALKEFKEDLKAADKLQGKARKYVEDRLEEMLSPRISDYSLKYAVEDAQRMGKSGKEALKDVSPSSALG